MGQGHVVDARPCGVVGTGADACRGAGRHQGELHEARGRGRMLGTPLPLTPQRGAPCGRPDRGSMEPHAPGQDPEAPGRGPCRSADEEGLQPSTCERKLQRLAPSRCPGCSQTSLVASPSPEAPSKGSLGGCVPALPRGCSVRAPPLLLGRLDIHAPLYPQWICKRRRRQSGGSA